MRIGTHPGEVLREELMAPLSLATDALAMALGVSATRLANIVHERRGIDADTALHLGQYFRTTPRFWLNPLADHDLSTKTSRNNSEVEQSTDR